MIFKHNVSPLSKRRCKHGHLVDDTMGSTDLVRENFLKNKSLQFKETTCVWDSILENDMHTEWHSDGVVQGVEH
jgi:hypothetical protein